MAGAILAASVPATVLGHNDGYLGSWQWPTDYVGTYRFDSNFTTGWMQSAVSRAVTPSSSANGVVSRGSNATSCNGGQTLWGACAQYSPSRLTWSVQFATEWCWTDGTSTSCTNKPTYDIESVALNEMGHVATLAHHSPTTSHDVQGAKTYGESVVQYVPDPFSHVFGVRRSLGLADTGALHARYGTDPSGCYPPPCAYSPVR